ncbi:MAG: hypothetical protein IT368_16755, partial [Candidatus Hydrogenedentes bacterium]|nr:hypothetical protein [Candidatus Hydrogenedentota bacterium]
MQIDQLHPPANEPPRIMQRFIVANILYLLLVHVWILGIPVLGRDLGSGAADNPLHLLFGEAAFLYQAVNILLLWICMISLFFLTRLALRGPWWLGSLSATLFMANPVKTEALVLHSGFADLWPAATALVSLALYAGHTRRPARLYYGAAFVFFILAVASPRNVLLFLVFLLYERLLVPRQSRRYGRLFPFAAAFVAALFIHLGPDQVRGAAADPIASFLPLYLILYPIGLLPETAHALMSWTPWFWIGAAIVALVLGLIYRKARHPAILFAVSSMLVLRLFQGEAFVEPVHLTGGGALLLPAAFFYLGISAIIRQ